MQGIDVKFKVFSEDAKVPTQGAPLSVGFDLFSTHDYVLNVGERYLFKTGFGIDIPDGFYVQIAPRSGLALKNGIAVKGGVIDQGYFGEVGVILKNEGESPLFVKKHDRIAQMLFIKCENRVNFIKVEDLGKSDRQEGGFGSTGK